MEKILNKGTKLIVKNETKLKYQTNYDG